MGRLRRRSRPKLNTMNSLDALVYLIILELFLGLLVIKRNPKSLQNICFAFICFGMASWVAGLYLLQTTRIFYWPDKIALFGGAVMVGGFYAFSQIFPTERPIKLNWKEPWRTNAILRLVPLLVLVILLPFNLFISKVVFSEDGFSPVNGPLFFLYALTCGWYILATLYHFYWQYKNNIGYKRQRVMYVILSFGFLLIVSLISDVLLPAFNVTSWKFFGPLSSVVFMTLSTISLISFNLIDIRLVFKTMVVNTFSLVIVLMSLAGLQNFIQLRNLTDKQTATFLIAGILLLFLLIRELLDLVFSKLFLKSYLVFKKSFEELNIFLHEEMGSDRLISVGNRYFKKGLGLSWVYYHDLVNDRMIYSPHEDPIQGGKITAEQVKSDEMVNYLGSSRAIKLLYGTELETFPKVSNSPIALLPLWNSGVLMGYFVLGPQRSFNGLSAEETHMLQYSWAHMETAFDRALLWEGLQQKVVAQVEDIEFKNKTLKELLKNRLDFIQVASHQLRTPLTALSGALEILYEGNPDSEERSEMIRMANEKARALSKIITGTLNLARFEQQKSNLGSDFDYVNLNEIFAGLLPIIEAAARAKGVVVDFEPIARAEVKGNKTYLEQAFFNILENAVQQTPDGRIRIHFLEKGESIVTCITDTGSGIDPEIRDKVFNRNVFGGNSRGLGLGLYIVKTIVDEHPGGKVWFETDSNGTTFFVELMRFKR